MHALTGLLAFPSCLAGPVADLPFELTGNRVYVHGIIRDRPTWVIFDTGAGANIVDADLAKSLHAKSSAEVPIGGAGATPRTALVLQDFEIAFKGTTLRASLQYGLSLADMAPLEGRPIEAVVGISFFKNYIVQFDYRAHRVRLFAPESYVAPNVATVPMRLITGIPHFESQIDIPGIGRKTVTMALDTGASRALTLTGRMIDREKLAASLANHPLVQIGMGIGGATMGWRLRAASVTLGQNVLQRPVADADQSTGGITGKVSSFDVLVGGEMLRRFKVTVDYPGKRIYFEPNAEAGDPFIGDQVGLHIHTLPKDFHRFEVFEVYPGSPGAEAGIKVGDEITDLNGVATSGLTLNDLRNALTHAEKPLRLSLARDGKERTVQIAPRETVP